MAEIDQVDVGADVGVKPEEAFVLADAGNGEGVCAFVDNTVPEVLHDMDYVADLCREHGLKCLKIFSAASLDGGQAEKGSSPQPINTMHPFASGPGSEFE